MSATLSQAPRPLPSLPASQASAGTPAPKDLIECITRYPRHPLLQFFNTETQRMLPGHPSHPANDPTKNAPRKTIDITLPAAVTLGDLAKERSSRAWAAPELRTKSSHELHQLWYVCLMERNKLDTSWEELRRTGTRQLAGMVSASFATRKRRVSITVGLKIKRAKEISVVGGTTCARGRKAETGGDAQVWMHRHESWKPTLVVHLERSSFAGSQASAK